ncbi:MAG: M23 family metallopeptidase, partial [Nanoarchaeota archaeon]|nr:M23 family metallopeptidase [Nanoarchaeota archaeon]
MKTSLKNKGMIGLLLVVLLLFLYTALAIQQSGGSGATVTPGALSSNQQPSSCANPQQCREIDEVWQMIGINVRNSDEIWDASGTSIGWKRFTAVYVPPTQPGSGVSGTTPTSGVMPAGYCFPVERDSFKENGNLNNWGDDRSGGDRCHAGLDLLTQGEGKIRAVDEGIVVNVQNFVSAKDCTRGTNVPGKALLIYHPNIQYPDAHGNMARGITINYGEMDADKILFKTDDRVQKGQYLGQALTCGMLHFEIYNGRVSETKKWNDRLPASTTGKNKCATEQEFLAVKPPEIMDPTNFINNIQNSFCDQGAVSSLSSAPSVSSSTGTLQKWENALKENAINGKSWVGK